MAGARTGVLFEFSSTALRKGKVEHCDAVNQGEMQSLPDVVSFTNSSPPRHLSPPKYKQTNKQPGCCEQESCMALVNTQSISRTIPLPTPSPRKKTHSPCLKIARQVSSSYLALLNQLVEFPAPMKNAVGHQEYPFSLVGNIGIYKPEERTDQKGSMFTTEQEAAESKKNSPQTCQAVKQQSVPGFRSSVSSTRYTCVSEINQNDPYIGNSSRYEKQNKVF